MTTNVDFEKAPPDHRWTANLAELRQRLQKEAYGAQGEWVWYILPHGALVSMRVPPTFQKELRIARRDPVKDEKAVRAWLTEIRTFQKHLEAEGWATVEMVGQPGGPGPIHVLLREPAPLGAKPDRCLRCGKPSKQGPYKENLCTACATAAGQAESDANRRAREESV